MAGVCAGGARCAVTTVDDDEPGRAHEYPSDDHVKAVCRSVRSWDDGTLTPDMVFEGLEAALWETAHLNDPPDVLLHEPAAAW